ncbi:MFS transporter [Paenibacillus nasutitermitis]|uniref:MFS transporter n=1 Tax=Paenibacillus nasutitermitis TaxID=1652958 RepID=A0A917DMQ0_9BACL|nr:MFS transporter [Paenibacillus nasutitermitis]GGD53289.1 MFS transporter [Paenibacillus nasutitermitis]
MASSFQLLRNGFVRTIFISNLFSQCGIWIRNFAILLYIMDRTNGDAFAVSMISIAEYAPIFIFSFVGGVFADRWRPKRTMVWCEYLSAFSVLIVFLILETGSWKAVFLATLCSSILSQFAGPSGMKLFKDHIQEEDAPACMSLLQTLNSLFMIIGPILGTFVYQQLGIKPSILLTGLSFLLSAFAMLFVPADPDSSKHRTAEQPSIFHEMADGFRYVWYRRELFRLSLCFTFVGLGVGLITPLSIFLVTERLELSAQFLQWLTIPYGLGEIIGGLVIFMIAAKVAPQRLLMTGLAVNGAGILLLGLSSQLWLTMLLQFFIAFLQPAIFVGNISLVMQQTEQSYIGRVTGIRTPLMTGSMLLMMSVSGTLKNTLSLASVYSMAAFCFMLGILIVMPLLKRKRSQTASFLG